MSNIRRGSIFTVILFLLLAGIVFDLPLISRSNKFFLIKIPKELKTTKEIGQRLGQEGALRHPKLFEKVMKLAQLDTKIQQGAYSLRKPEPWPSLIRKLVQGDTVTTKVTFPEGWRAAQIAERLDQQGVTDAKGFMEIVKKNNLEGYLYPSTYYFEPQSEPQEIKNLLTTSFEQSWLENFKGKIPPMNLNRNQVVTLASIIERETTVLEEMPVIAGVYLNRLEKKWKLEADPTVQYALGYWKNRLTYQDTKVDSPYNTYRRFGLPPGPICNPGKNAIAAVFAPAKTSNMYFVADGNGSHSFFETLKDHNRAKRKMIKSMKEQGKIK